MKKIRGSRNLSISLCCGRLVIIMLFASFILFDIRNIICRNSINSKKKSEFKMARLRRVVGLNPVWNSYLYPFYLDVNYRKIKTNS